MTPSRAGIACLAVLVLTVGCGPIDGSPSAAEGTGLVVEVSPAQVQPGLAFTATFPPDGMVITHPALELALPGQPLAREAELPADVEPGTLRICSEEDCAEFEVIGP